MDQRCQSSAPTIPSRLLRFSIYQLRHDIYLPGPENPDEAADLAVKLLLQQFLVRYSIQFSESSWGLWTLRTDLDNSFLVSREGWNR